MRLPQLRQPFLSFEKPPALPGDIYCLEVFPLAVLLPDVFEPVVGFGQGAHRHKPGACTCGDRRVSTQSPGGSCPRAGSGCPTPARARPPVLPAGRSPGCRRPRRSAPWRRAWPAGVRSISRFFKAGGRGAPGPGDGGALPKAGEGFLHLGGKLPHPPAGSAGAPPAGSWPAGSAAAGR